MNAETEKLTSKYAMEVYNSEFIFVTDFAKTKRAFYHMRKNDVPEGFDLIWKGMEIRAEDLYGGIPWKKCTTRQTARPRRSWRS